MGERRTFRIVVTFPDGGTAEFDVTEAQVHVWEDAPLEITTEFGLKIKTPDVEGAVT